MMDSSAVSSKKRKHSSTSSSQPSTAAPSSTTANGHSQGLIFSVSADNSKDALRPLLASTPAVSLPRDTQLTLYTSYPKGKGRASSSSSSKLTAAASMLHGESGNKLEWHSANRLFGYREGHPMNGESSGAASNGNDEVIGHDVADDGETTASYALAIYDPSNGSVSMISTPLHILQHTPKRLKAVQDAANLSNAALTNTAARAQLGMTFGTKKAQKNIRAAERNKVDAGTEDLQVVQEVMMEKLQQGLSTLPATPSKLLNGARSALDIPAYVENARKTGMPVPDPNADSPSEVYTIFGDIISDKEYDSINPNMLIKASTTELASLFGKLPNSRSVWINDRLRYTLSVSNTANADGSEKKGKKRRVKTLLWLSAMLALKSAKKLDPNNQEELNKRFSRSQSLIPAECWISLCERFGEQVRGTTT